MSSGLGEVDEAEDGGEVLRVVALAAAAAPFVQELSLEVSMVSSFCCVKDDARMRGAVILSVTPGDATACDDALGAGVNRDDLLGVTVVGRAVARPLDSVVDVVFPAVVGRMD